MSPESQLLLELALLGLCTGYVAGLLGIGGGMLLGPFITIIFKSISSVRAHHKRSAVKWDIAGGLAPGIVLGSMVGSIGNFSLRKGTTLALVFALHISFSATQMIMDKKPMPGRKDGEFVVRDTAQAHLCHRFVRTGFLHGMERPARLNHFGAH
jgi:uncharacterized membrane protein YfcA